MKRNLLILTAICFAGVSLSANEAESKISTEERKIIKSYILQAISARMT